MRGLSLASRLVLAMSMARSRKARCKARCFRKRTTRGAHVFEQIGTRRRGSVRARNTAQDLYLRTMKRHELVFAEGPAGTGKTWLAVGFAVLLLEQGVVERIILSRPALEAGERLGFLPGDMRDKVDPYLRPIYDALADFMDARMLERGMQTGMIEVAPLAFMRGRTLSNACVLLDEAQNATSMQMKMFLTRLGEGSRMIVTGDPTQTDLPPGQKSGLSEAIGLLSGLEGIGHVVFKESDVVRHDLVRKIVGAYEAAARKVSGQEISDEPCGRSRDRDIDRNPEIGRASTRPPNLRRRRSVPRQWKAAPCSPLAPRSALFSATMFSSANSTANGADMMNPPMCSLFQAERIRPSRLFSATS